MRGNLLAILILALGIGAAATLFSFVNPLLVHPLVYPRADRLMTIEEIDPKGSATPVSLDSFHNWNRAQRSSQLAAYDIGVFFLTGVTEPEQVYGALVTPNLFDVLEVQPMLGRGLREGEPDAVVLTYGAWQRHFGGDPGVIGRTIDLDFARTPEVERYRVVGVMPPDFWMFYGAFEVFVPMNERALNPKAHALYAVARLADDATRQQAAATLPSSQKGWGIRVTPWATGVAASIRKQILAVTGGAVLLLLIACTNVAGLLLTRAFARRRETSIRAALGASPTRLMRWSLGNSLKVALAAGVLGTLFAWIGVRILIAILPADIVSRGFVPGFDRVAINAPALVFTLLTVLAVSLACGALPAWNAARIDVWEALKSASGMSSQRLRRVLVAIEVALSVMLLAGAGMIGKTLANIAGIDLGFRVDNLLVLRVPTQNRDRAQVQNLRIDLLRRVSAIPGIVSASLASAQPLTGNHGNVDVRIAGRNDTVTTGIVTVSPNYFSTLGFALRAGRFLNDSDRGKVIVDETLARKLWPDRNPVGETMVIDDDTVPVEVIGVVAATRPFLLENPTPLVYRSFFDNPQAAGQMAIRTSGDPLKLARAVTAIARDEGAVIADVSTMREFVDNERWAQRLAAVLFASFSGIALILAAAGVYGVVSMAVNQRTREIGIRMALGADSARVVALVIAESTAPVALGVAVGLLGALAGGRFVESLLYEVRPADPVILTSVASLAIVVSLVACWPSARRAASVDPSRALRAD